MHKRTRSVAGVVVASLALAASSLTCGGGSGSASCGGTQPCGGDVNGTWKASSACVDSTALNMAFLGDVATDCPTATITNVHYTPSGTMTFGSGMTYTAAVTMAMSFNMNIPTSCLSGGTCADANAGIQSIVGTDGVTSASCTGTTTCVCTVAGTVDVENSAGTYATAGTVLTLTATSGGNGDSGDYCVKGSSLHLITVDMSMAMAKITGDIVLTKQ